MYVRVDAIVLAGILQVYVRTLKVELRDRSQRQIKTWMYAHMHARTHK